MRRSPQATNGEHQTDPDRRAWSMPRAEARRDWPGTPEQEACVETDRDHSDHRLRAVRDRHRAGAPNAPPPGRHDVPHATRTVAGESPRPLPGRRKTLDTRAPRDVWNTRVPPLPLHQHASADIRVLARGCCTVDGTRVEGNAGPHAGYRVPAAPLPVDVH